MSHPSHCSSHTQPHPTRAAQGKERAPGMAHPSPTSLSHPESPSLTAESRADLPPEPSSTSKSCPSPPIISNVAQVHLGAAWLHLSGARALPNTAPAGDGTAREGTRWVTRAPTQGSAGVRPQCCQSQPLEHTQTGAGRLEICIGYGDGRKGSSGAAWSWLRPHPQVPKSRSVPLPPQGGLSPQAGPTCHQDATSKTPHQSLLP